jgi:DNA-directed RNA polymerase specialized sigma24 family protein
MDDLIKLVRTYRLTAGLTDRERLADDIFSQIEPAMRLFVNGKIRPQFADDVLQEVLKAIVISLPQFTGDDVLKWCRGIARHKIHDQYQANAKASERFQALPPEEIWDYMNASAQDMPFATGERLDLDYAMKLLAESKPECVEYLLKHFVSDLDHDEIAAEENIKENAMRMRIERCLETVRELVA